MRVVAIADLHTDSVVGLALPGRGGAVGQPIREAIYQQWEAATKGPWKRPDVLIVNGDLVEGQNRKSGGVGVITTDLYEQIDDATELLGMWNAKRIYIIRGSGYNVEADHSGLQCEEQIARNLGAEEYPNQEHIDVRRRDRSGWHWYITIGTETFHVSHHIAVSKVFHYMSTPTARAMLDAKLNDMLRHEVGKHRTSIVLRAHAHYFNHVEYSGSHGFVLPCWKAVDVFAMKRGAISLSPDLGYLGFEIGGGGMRYEKRLIRLVDVQAAPHTIVK